MPRKLSKRQRIARAKREYVRADKDMLRAHNKVIDIATDKHGYIKRGFYSNKKAQKHYKKAVQEHQRVQKRYLKASTKYHRLAGW